MKNREKYSLEEIDYSTGKYISILNPIFNILFNFNKITQRLYQKFFSGIIIADEVNFELYVIK